MAAPAPTAHPIHPIYRLTFNWLEPILAVGGIIQILYTPYTYTAISHPTLHASLAPHHALHDPLQTLFTCIAGGWAILAFNDLVTLRIFARQPDVWRCVILAHLCSDALYVLALAEDVGFAHFVDPRVWSGEEWFTNVLTLPPLVLKVALVMGVGVDYGYGKAGRGKGKRA